MKLSVIDVFDNGRLAVEMFSIQNSLPTDRRLLLLFR